MSGIVSDETRPGRMSYDGYDGEFFEDECWGGVLLWHGLSGTESTRLYLQELWANEILLRISHDHDAMLNCAEKRNVLAGEELYEI